METLTAVRPSEAEPLPNPDIEAEVAASMVNFDQKLTEVLDEGTSTIEKDGTSPEKVRAWAVAKKLGRTIMTQTIIQGGGAVLDGALLAGAGISVGLFRPLAGAAGREAVATMGDVAAMDRVNNWLDNRGTQVEAEPAGVEELAQPETQTRLRKAGGVLGRMAAMTAASVIAVKVGPVAAEYLNSNLGSGNDAFAIAVGSKIGAVAGVGKLMSRGA